MAMVDYLIRKTVVPKGADWRAPVVMEVGGTREALRLKKSGHGRHR